MQNFKIYEINPEYIDYLSLHEERIFHNKKESQTNSRKYIGIIFSINGADYFALLSSFKQKHKKLSETVDFIKLGDLAVINLNNMIPVPKQAFWLYDIFNEKNAHYKNLLNDELRIIKSKSETILQNAKAVYEHKLKHGASSKLGKRCNDFLLLEKLCREYEG